MDPTEGLYGCPTGHQSALLTDPYGYQQQQPVYNSHQQQQQQTEPIYQTLTPISQSHQQSEAFKVYNYSPIPQHQFQDYIHQHHQQQQQGLIENNPVGYSFVDLQQHQNLQIPPPALPLSIPAPSQLPPLPPPPPPQPLATSKSTAANSATSTSAANSSSSSSSSQQSHCTFKWLETNFQFRSHVSISRSTIYELYQKFCSQNGFVAVCKATFGKIIRIKFPKVKSKRLGARGQSKYHYYNITFKDERKRCSMLLTSSHEPPAAEGRNQSSNSSPFLNHHQNQQHLPQYSTTPLEHRSHLDSQNVSWNLPDHQNPSESQQPFLSAQQQQNLFPEFTHSPTSSPLVWPPSARPAPPAYQQLKTQQQSFHHSNQHSIKSPHLSSQHQQHQRLTIFSNRHSAHLESYTHFSLNENDYHAIIQSMLSYMRLPVQYASVPLNNDRFVFINLYQIHCQCLLDSALAANLAQMRHYVMHFWQQLPRTVAVFSRTMAALDAHMYALLEDIYAGSVEAPLEGLRRLNTVAHLLPVWLKRTFQVVVPNSLGGGGGDNCWALLELEDNTKEKSSLVATAKSVGEIKVEEALRWSCRIKFKVDFIVSIKKLNCELLPTVVQRLLALFDDVYQADSQLLERYLDCSNEFSSNFRLPQKLIHSSRPSGHLFHQTASLLWHTLLREFRSMLSRLLKVESPAGSETSKAEADSEKKVSEEGKTTTLNGQLLVDELDRLVLTIQAQMETQLKGNGCSSDGGGSGIGGGTSTSSSSWSTANHHRLYANLTLLFGRLVDDLLGWLAVEGTLQKLDELLVDEFVEEEEEEEIEEEKVEADIEEESEEEATTSAQLYLLLTSMHAYLVEICQTVLRKRRFGHLEDAWESA